MPASCLDVEQAESAALSWHFFLPPSADLAQRFSSQPRRVGRFRGLEAEAALLPAWAPRGLGPLGASEASQGMDSLSSGACSWPATGPPAVPPALLQSQL